MEPVDLCVPIYLNQQIVFDLLAMLEDGFSQLSVVRTSATETERQESGIGASIGATNVFAFLAVSLSGKRGKEKRTKEQTEVSTEKVHTPASLFAKLRRVLDNEKLLKVIKTREEIQALEGGQFVEFRAVLRKNPLVDAIETFRQIGEMAMLFSGNPSGGSKPTKSGKGGAQPDPNQRIMRQLNAMLDALTQSNFLELIGEMLEIPSAKAVLSAKIDFFSDRNASEIIDGEFRVLGKVIRVIGYDSADAINLLRKTSLGRLDPRIFDQFKSGFAGAAQAGINFPEVITEIRGPALQIIPIAIFA